MKKKIRADRFRARVIRKQRADGEEEFSLV